MAEAKRTYTKDKTVGTVVSLPCSKCVPGTKDHTVKASVEEHGNYQDEYSWNAAYQVVQCGGCRTLSFRTNETNSEDVHQVGQNEWETQETQKLYPSRVEGRTGIGRDIIYLPNKVRRIYTETEQALASQSPVLTGIGLRALLETVCKEKNAKGRDLFKKINFLRDTSVLTPSGAKILHRIRSLGNDAAHEVEPHTDTQLGAGLDVIEHLLRDVYIMEAKMTNVFGELTMPVSTTTKPVVAKKQAPTRKTMITKSPPSKKVLPKK